VWRSVTDIYDSYAARSAAAASDLEISLIPVTIPEMLRGTVILPPRRDHAYRQHWSQWRRRRQYRASQAHRHLNAYACGSAYPGWTDRRPGQRRGRMVWMKAV